MKKGLGRGELMGAMGVGDSGRIRKWFEQNTLTRASFKIVEEGSFYVLYITGDAVFYDLTIEEDLKFPGLKNRLKLINTEGKVIFLSDIPSLEIMERIKKNYHQIHVDCIGKTVDKINFILYSCINKVYTAGNITVILHLDEGVVERGKDYLDSLPDNPTHEQYLDLAYQIKSGHLEYPMHSINENYFAKDEHGFGMDIYANSLERRYSAKINND